MRFTREGTPHSGGQNEKGTAETAAFHRVFAPGLGGAPAGVASGGESMLNGDLEAGSTGRLGPGCLHPSMASSGAGIPGWDALGTAE